VLAALEHPGIVPVHDVGTLADGRVFYTMKFVEGQRLDKYIESVTSFPDRLRIFLRICDAVAFAHARSVLHRDLKPANVMVGPFGEVLVDGLGPRQNSSQEASSRAANPIQKSHFSKSLSSMPPLSLPRISVVTGHGTVMGSRATCPGASARRRGTLGRTQRYLFSCALLAIPAHRPARSGFQFKCPRLEKSLAASAQSRPPRLPRIATPTFKRWPWMFRDTRRHGSRAHRESILEKAGAFTGATVLLSY